METLLTAPGIMTGLGLFFGVILAIASRVFKVDEDPRISATEEMLPGTNCGACGEPGCLPFAQKLVIGEIQPGKCTVASADDIDNIADFLGVDAGDSVKQVARLHCAGGTGQAYQIAEYQGFESCRSAAVVSGGGKGCSWGCLGLADCEVSCDFDAIQMSQTGLPVVDIDKCTACNDCIEACPKDLFELVPIDQKLFVQCSIPLAGEKVTMLCNVGCDACGKCAADAPVGLIEMVNELPVIHYETGLPVTPKATSRCPTGSIVWLEAGQFNNESAHERENRERYAQLT